MRHSLAASLLLAVTAKAFAGSICTAGYAELEADPRTQGETLVVKLGIGIRFSLRTDDPWYAAIPGMPNTSSFQGRIRARFAADGVDCTGRALRSDLVELSVSNAEAITAVIPPWPGPKPARTVTPVVVSPPPPPRPPPSLQPPPKARDLEDRSAKAYVCEVDGRRRVSYRAIPGCANREVVIDPATAMAVPLFLPDPPRLNPMEQERLDLWRADPAVKGACVVRVNPAVFDANMISTTIDGQLVTFQVWSTSPQGNNVWPSKGSANDSVAWSGRTYPMGSGAIFGPEGSLYIARDPKSRGAISYATVSFGGRGLSITPVFLGEPKLALREQKGGQPLAGGSFDIDASTQAKLDQLLMRKFPDEATYQRTRTGGDALSRQIVAHAPELDVTLMFDTLYGPHLERMKKIWAGARPGFLEYTVPAKLADNRPRVLLAPPCEW